MIRLRLDSKTYGVRRVLENISLDLARGRVYGLVGENGAGKSTLFRCIAGLEGFDGEIESDLRPLKDHLGYLPTDPFFFARMTAREYLSLVTRARRTAVADFDTPNLFDLPLDQYAATFSTGMKKKLALTGILLQDNDVFILDEPSNGVDIQGNILITEIIHRLRGQGKTVLIASHIFSTLADACDEIFVIEAGRVTRHIGRTEFPSLERDMRSFAIGDRLEKLGL